MNDQTKLCAIIFSGLLAFSALPAMATDSSITGPTNPAEPISPVPPSIPPVDTDTGTDQDGRDSGLRSNDPQEQRRGTDGTGTSNDMNTAPRNNNGIPNDDDFDSDVDDDDYDDQ